MTSLEYLLNCPPNLFLFKINFRGSRFLPSEVVKHYDVDKNVQSAMRQKDTKFCQGVRNVMRGKAGQPGASCRCIITRYLNSLRAIWG